MSQVSRVRSFPDKHQNFWHLTSIQGMSFALPGLILPGILAKQFGNGTALCSLLIGNLITWFISVSIVSMSSKLKNNAIENVKSFLGEKIGLLVSLILLIALLIWYALQITSFTSVVEKLHLLDIKNVNLFLGSIVGIIIAILAIGGIRFIRLCATFIFPILFIFVIFILVKYLPEVSFADSWGISPAAVALSIAIELPGTINLPTFFRHSNSKAGSILALVLINLYLDLYGLAGICLGSIEFDKLVQFLNDSKINVIVLFIIAFFSLVGTNLTNIYFASAGWEAFMRRIDNWKKYLILGILGTIIFSLFHEFSLNLTDSPLVILANLVNGFLSCLTIILLVAYLMAIIVQHRNRRYEKLFNNLIWAIGCIIFSVVYLVLQSSWSEALLNGIGLIIFSYVIVLFVEEARWAITQIANKK